MIAVDLPDLPRWVEAHGIATDPAGWRTPVGAGFALGHDTAKLIVVVGDAAVEAVRELAHDHPSHTLLLEIEREQLAEAVRRAGRGVDRALLHTLPDPDTLPELEGADPLPAEASLAHVPAELATELEAARASHTVWTAWVDGEPVSFAYAPWRSARWFDVSVDTLAGARQLGLATLVAAAMIRDERGRGREPVWGADEHNVASIRLAKRLGFVESDAIWVCPGAG
ncbi:MAG: GNAT family N-acetyltransferase [Kofleriaceae bacterium]